MTELRRGRFSWGEGDLILDGVQAPGPVSNEETEHSQKVRNWLVDDDLNRDWMKMYLRLFSGKKGGSFITDDEGRVLFIGGPGSGAGGAQQYVLPGVLLADRWGDARRFDQAHPGDEEAYGTDAWRDSLNALTEDEKEAIMTYTSSAYEAINAGMRDYEMEMYEDNSDLEIAARNWASKKGYTDDEIEEDLPYVLSDYQSHVISNLDSALEKARVPEDIVVFRGVQDDHFLYGTEEGTMFSDPAYMSTSLSPMTAKSFGGVMVEIRVPAGARGLYLDGTSDVPREFEVLFERSTALRMVERGEKHYILEVVP